MLPPVKAIETRYAGYRFRSRLEARWAVYHDYWYREFGTNWDYEPEGFQLPSGWYLPDFRLQWSDLDFEWIEVKGRPPTTHEKQLAYELCIATSYPVRIVTDIPREGEWGNSWRVWPFREKFVEFEPWPYGGGVDDPDDLAACTAARSARFEHGESG